MLGLAGLLSVAAGGVVAYLSPRFPAHLEALETATGLLLITGFALTACGLPTIL
ncbi:MAG TPA: hypothetical protein VH206_18910 [Xanthobacteraceae bacterium]|jgi:hypothetical protein|nr:hypothetical protein [Xanthobacteraceae bacterium]